ncbi:alanine racemase [Actinomadura barringtoniae]|uniref:Alanine racemase n=1 Tax=Actinomadura barringtoniae TaxID=1427535 RepID=A0A939T7E3_9ACTN|nr:alanine racemase [Actinomadura barringtoniae]MBO2451914.1 alanine racemase [Actinomadura barringtoniae]
MSVPYEEIDTPALIVDLDTVAANIAEMAGVMARNGVRLRPHIKTHKMPEIARLQLEAGAAGITCAKLGEAEVMADAGCDDILLAFPLWGRPKLERIAALRERARVRVSLDSVEVAEGLGGVGGASPDDPIEVFVEVDTGLHRLGRPPGVPTAELVAAVRKVPGVSVAGLLTHAGHSYRSTSLDELRAVAEREVTDLTETAELCGGELEISVGSTPTSRFGAAVPGVTEIRPGTYVFNDATMIRLGVATEATAAARVLTTVIARPAPDRFVVDAGSKSLTSDGAGTPGWIMVAGRPELSMRFLSEEHGIGRCAAETAGPEIGERLELIPSHACPVSNLFDTAYGVRGGRLDHELAVAARGKVR